MHTNDTVGLRAARAPQAHSLRHWILRAGAPHGGWCARSSVAGRSDVAFAHIHMWVATSHIHLWGIAIQNGNVKIQGKNCIEKLGNGNAWECGEFDLAFQVIWIWEAEDSLLKSPPDHMLLMLIGI